MAFLYRPIILEGPQHSYLIGWGDTHMVQDVEHWAENAGPMKIFCWPAMEVRAGPIYR